MLTDLVRRRLMMRGGGVVGCGGCGCGGRGQGAVGAGRVDAGAVEVHVQPPAVALVPDASLLGLLRVGQTLSGI